MDGKESTLFLEWAAKKGYISVYKDPKEISKEFAKSRRKKPTPTLEEVENFFIEKGYKKEVAKRAFEYYSVAEWKDANGKQVRNWKQKMMGVWFKDENKRTKYAGYNKF